MMRRDAMGLSAGKAAKSFQRCVAHFWKDVMDR